MAEAVNLLQERARTLYTIYTFTEVHRYMKIRTGLFSAINTPKTQPSVSDEHFINDIGHKIQIKNPLVTSFKLYKESTKNPRRHHAGCHQPCHPAPKIFSSYKFDFQKITGLQPLARTAVL